jgi:hypothetical protein
MLLVLGIRDCAPLEIVPCRLARVGEGKGAGAADLEETDVPLRGRGRRGDSYFITLQANAID